MLCTWQHFRAKEELERRGARRGSDGQQGVVAPAPACGDCARVPRILGSSDTRQAFLVFTACTALISANRTFTVLKCTLCPPHFYHFKSKALNFYLTPTLCAARVWCDRFLEPRCVGRPRGSRFGPTRVRGRRLRCVQVPAWASRKFRSKSFIVL